MNEEIRKEFEAIKKRLDLLEKSSRGERVTSQDASPNHTFEEQDEKVIVTQVIGDTPKEKTKNLVLLSLLGYKQRLGETEVRASKLRENVAVHGIPLENFGTYVKELIPQSVIKKGKKGSTKVTYKLTIFGEAKARNLLKSVLENEKSK